MSLHDPAVTTRRCTCAPRDRRGGARESLEWPARAIVLAAVLPVAMIPRIVATFEPFVGLSHSGIALREAVVGTARSVVVLRQAIDATTEAIGVAFEAIVELYERMISTFRATGTIRGAVVTMRGAVVSMRRPLGIDWLALASLPGKGPGRTGALRPPLAGSETDVPVVHAASAPRTVQRRVRRVQDQGTDQ